MMIGPWIPDNPALLRKLRIIEVAALVVFLFITWFFYLLFDRDPPRSDINFVLLTPVLHRGEDLEIEWKFTVNRNCPGYSNRALVSLADPDWSYPLHELGIGYVRPEVLPFPRKIYARPLTVPTSAPIGDAYFQIVVVQRCNWAQIIWPIETRYPVVPFKIAP